MYNSPLEQFEIQVLLPLPLTNYIDISFTNSVLYTLLAAGSAFGILYLSLYKAKLMPTRWQTASEAIYKFVLDMVKQQAGTEGYKYFPLIFTTFIFILFSNLIGLIPLGFTPTAHISLTFALAFSFNLA